jgi:hypothetical protein
MDWQKRYEDDDLFGSRCSNLSHWLMKWTREHETDESNKHKESRLVTESWKYKREMARKEHLEAFHHG